jgi:hypothetical protein
MNRKFALTLIAVFLLASFAASPALAAKNYFAERYDVTIVVQPGGSLVITETIVFHFEGGPFTYVFRDLAYANLDEIDRLQASMDGQVLPQGNQPGQVEIEAGRPLKVTWHFPPASDSTHEFTLVYRVQGAFRQSAGADTLIWRAIPEDHAYTIDRATIRVEYPTGFMPLSDPVLDGVTAGFEVSAKGVVFTTQAIKVDQPVDVTIQFPPGSLISQPPAWQARQQERELQVKEGMPYGFGAAALTAVLGLAGVLLLGLGFRRDVVAETYAPGHFSSPPKEIPPALPARLVGSGTFFLGTLFDLARRGVLSIEEGAKKWGSRSFEIVRLPTTENFTPHEHVFLQALFQKARPERVALAKIASLASHGRFTQAIDQELIAAGWRDVRRSAQRTRFLVSSVLGMVLGLAVFLAGLLFAASSLNAGVGGASWGRF